MKPLRLILNKKNFYRSVLRDSRNNSILAGSNGLDSVRIEYRGKRMMVTLVVPESHISVYVDEGECPEHRRYEEAVRPAIGDRAAIQKLHPSCELLLISPYACDGCPYQPEEPLSSDV